MLVKIYKMSNLLENMFKRFCLPKNSDVQLYENGNMNVSSCVCGNYNHVSCCFRGKWDYKKS